MIDRFALDEASLVVEVASNDGYLLQWFVKAGIPCLGIEPAANVAAAATERSVPTLVRYFGVELADELVARGQRPDLLLGNNVLAQVPDLNDFVAGVKKALAGEGVVTLEFPHVLRLIDENQFDTIYHEHFSYFSLHTIRSIFRFHGLELFDVDELPTHGGSLRVYGRHGEDHSKPVSASVADLLDRETRFGLTTVERYSAFARQVEDSKRRMLALLIELKADAKQIVGYGAPGKGNTLLNYCGIRTDFLDFTVDRNPYKQGLYTPGTHIPILPPDALIEARPDYIFVLPWNIKDEIIEQMAMVRDWGAKFIVPVPEARIL
jgi:hypothetical protein